MVVSVERVTQTLQSYAGTAVTAMQAELDEFDGYAQVGYGNYNEKEYRGVLNLPVIDDVAAARICW